MPRSMLLPSALALILAVAVPVAPGPARAAVPEGDAVGASAASTLDMIFTERDFSNRAEGVTWRLDLSGPQLDEPQLSGFLPVSDGRLVLRPATDKETGEKLLELQESEAGRDRVLGRYPIGTGDPALLFFLETVTRNMAMFAQGNPDYIRNRIKDALRNGGTQGVTAEQGHVVTLAPFINDPNAARMAGFDQLTLVFVLQQDTHAPILSMTAEAPAAGYSLRLTEVDQ